MSSNMSQQVLTFIYTAGRRRCSSVFAPVPMLSVGVLMPARDSNSEEMSAPYTKF